MPLSPFTYSAPVDLTFGAGTIAQLGEKLTAYGVSKALVVTDRGLVQFKVIDPVLDSLRAAGIEFILFDAVEENPKDTTTERAAATARETACDVILGVGGGSPMDVAKMVAVLVTHPGKRCQDFEGRGKVQHDPALLAMVPTTAGTASEVTFNAVITDTERKVKMVINSPKIAPRFAILDPLLTLSKPPGLTAATGVDALTHAIESYTNRTYNPIADALSTHAIRLIGRSLRTAWAQGQDLQARSDMLLGSLLAGMAFNYTRLGIVHAMSHPVSAHFGVAHGIANAILLPRVMEYNLFGAIPQTAHIAELLGEDVGGLSELEAARKGVEAVYKLNRDLGIPGSLRAVGVTEDRIPQMAKDTMVSGNIPVNPRLVTEKEIIRLYHEFMAER